MSLPSWLPKTGCNLINLAANHSPECLSILIVTGTPLDGAVVTAAGQFAPECLRMLIAAGADLEALDYNGQHTPLTLAARGTKQKARAMDYVRQLLLVPP